MDLSKLKKLNTTGGNENEINAESKKEK